MTGLYIEKCPFASEKPSPETPTVEERAAMMGDWADKVIEMVEKDLGEFAKEKDKIVGIT